MCAFKNSTKNSASVLLNLNWNKGGGLLPAVVQDSETGAVLMMGYMSRAALATTLETGFVTFYSRSKLRLWTKGETSGNKLCLKDIQGGCDADAIAWSVNVNRRLRKLSGVSP